MKQGQNKIVDKIFQITYKGVQCNFKRFVHFKLKNIKNNKKVDNEKVKMLIQIIDVSDKMLYDEVKAEKSF